MRKIKRHLVDISLPSVIENPIQVPQPTEQTVFSKVQMMSEEISVEQVSLRPAATLRINNLSIDIHNGADSATIETLLQLVQRVC